MVPRGLSDRLSSLDASIQLSLDSERLAKSPGAFVVLQVLSLLPDGVECGDLVQMVNSDFDVLRACATLVQCSLAYHEAEDRLQCLAPIREHIACYNTPNCAVFTPVFAFYCRLAAQAREGQCTSDSDRIELKFARNLDNIRLILLQAMAASALKEASIQAVLDLCAIASDRRGTYFNFFNCSPRQSDIVVPRM